MSEKSSCPSCKADSAQRISEIMREQIDTGKPSSLASQYHPPKQPWAYLQGFFVAVPVNVGLMLSMVSPETSEANTAVADVISTFVFLGVWAGYGIWKTKGYTKKMDEWKKAVASRFACVGCGHVYDA